MSEVSEFTEKKKKKKDKEKPTESNGIKASEGKFHDQGDTKWIVIRGKLRGHNDMPFGCPQGVFGGLSCY
jgi:hypothetical protein